MNTAPLLFELRTEEIPAAYIEPSLRQFKTLLIKSLKENFLGLSDDDEIKIFATSRRLCLSIEHFPLKQLEKSEVIKGPPLRVALKDGKPTPALLGFLKKTGQDSYDSFQKETIKGQEYFTFEQKVGGKNSEEVLPKIISSILKDLSFPKKMRWGNKDFLYPRPITGLLFLLGSNLVNMEIAGLASKANSVGHFLLAPDTFSVSSADEYFSELEKSFVLLNQSKRRAKIQKLLLEKRCKLFCDGN